MFKDAKHIFQAKVPVIKLETVEEFKCKKVDITLIDEKHNGLECAEMIISYLKKYPMLKSIFLVLKEMLFLACLNDPSQVYDN
jgi:DNA polymerase sigma